MDALLQRVRTRLVRSDEVTDDLLYEYIQTAVDRVLLRVGELSLPDALRSIVVDVSVKMYRRQYHEGISSENVDSLTTSFVDDMLEEYETDLWEYVKNRDRERHVVRFI